MRFGQVNFKYSTLVSQDRSLGLPTVTLTRMSMATRVRDR